MSEIGQLAARMRRYVSALDRNISDAVMTVEQDLLDLNREKLIEHRGGLDGKPLIHTSTGVPELSKPYAKLTNKTYPDIWVDGTFQSEMFLFIADTKNYYIQSKSRINKYLVLNYENMFGIAPEDQPKARELTGEAITQSLRNQVFLGS